MKEITLITLLVSFSLFFSNNGSTTTSKDMDESLDQYISLFHAVIDKEIMAKREKIQNIYQAMTVMDMSIEAQARASAVINIHKHEIDHLKELKEKGTNKEKYTYCHLILHHKVAMMTHEIKFGTEFGEMYEAFPGSKKRNLTEDEIKIIKENLEGITRIILKISERVW